MRLTIGIPTFDDYHSLLWTVQMLRLNHQAARDAEWVIVDNNPASAQGKRTSGYINGWVPQSKYVPMPEPKSPALAKSRCFAEASGDIVLVLDSHVALAPGAIDALLSWYQEHPDFRGLLTGPLLSAGLQVMATGFADRWRGEMWGTWAKFWACRCKVGRFEVDQAEADPRIVAANAPKVCQYFEAEWGRKPIDSCHHCNAPLPLLDYYGHEKPLSAMGYRVLGEDDGNAFPVPMSGCGLLACLRDAWLGFHAGVRQFGAEEGCLHQRYLRHGLPTLCLPSLKWWHVFKGPEDPVPYPRDRSAKVRNYVLEFTDLGLDLAPIRRHFVDGNFLSPPQWDKIVATASDPPSAPQPPPANHCATCLLPDDLTLEQWYTLAQAKPGDINEHMPKLRELAAAVDSVTEFGTRLAVSTVALLSGQPKTLVSYDRNRSAVADELTKRRGQTAFQFVQEDVLTIGPIDPTDLLFIDTKHTAEQLRLELDRHANSVRRWICLHDTQIFGEKGEDGGPGLLVALREFLRARPEWSVIYHTQRQHGLTVISKDPADRPKLPPMAAQAWNYARASFSHIAGGWKRADDATIDARLDVCSTCDQRTSNRCAICGCYLDSGPLPTDGKATWSEQECPLGKWGRE